MTKEEMTAVLEKVRTWPEEDQQELIELAREIEARRSGIYVLTDEERAAIEEAERTPIVPDEDVKAFWRARGIV